MIQAKSWEGLDGEEIGLEKIRFRFGEVEKTGRTLRKRWHFFSESCQLVDYGHFMHSKSRK